MILPSVFEVGRGGGGGGWGDTQVTPTQLYPGVIAKEKQLNKENLLT